MIAKWSSIEFSSTTLFNTTLCVWPNWRWCSTFHLTQANACYTVIRSSALTILWNVESNSLSIRYRSSKLVKRSDTVFASVSNLWCFDVDQGNYRSSHVMVSSHIGHLDLDLIGSGRLLQHTLKVDPQVTAGFPRSGGSYTNRNDALFAPGMAAKHYINNVQTIRQFMLKYSTARIVTEAFRWNFVVNTLAPPLWSPKRFMLARRHYTFVNPIFEKYSWSNGDSDYTTEVSTPKLYNYSTETGAPQQNL